MAHFKKNQNTQTDLVSHFCPVTVAVRLRAFGPVKIGNIGIVTEAWADGDRQHAEEDQDQLHSESNSGYF